MGLFWLHVKMASTQGRVGRERRLPAMACELVGAFGCFWYFWCFNGGLGRAGIDESDDGSD